MKQLKLLTVLVIAFFLGGCENMLKTMVAHYTITDSATRLLAGVNAAINVCLADKKMDPAQAYNFSALAADYLDMVVFDSGVYKSAYASAFDGAYGMRNTAQFDADCAAGNSALPAVTAKLQQQYAYAASQLNIARASESAAFAQTASNFGKGGAPAFVPTYPPNIQFSSAEEQKTKAYLVNTGSGLKQCRVTKSSYVFCI